MIGRVATKATRMARGTALATGVAVMLALVVGVSATAGSGGSGAGASVACDTEDFALSGGYFDLDQGTYLDFSAPGLADNTPGWQLHWTNDATPDTVTVVVLRADVGTPHQ